MPRKRKASASNENDKEFKKKRGSEGAQSFLGGDTLESKERLKEALNLRLTTEGADDLIDIIYNNGGVVGGYHVVQSAILVQVDSKSSKYYIMQIIHGDEIGVVMWQRWGRLDNLNFQSIQTLGGTEDLMMRFNKILKKKTGYAWDEVSAESEPKPGKYRLVDL